MTGAFLPALSALASGACVYAFLRFRRLKPLEESLREARERMQGGLSAAMRELDVAQTQLVRKSREVKTLYDVASTLTSHVSQTQSTLSAVISIVAKSLEADLVAFLLLDEETGELATQPGAFGLESDEMLYRLPLSEESSSSVRVFKSGEAFITGDAQNDPGVISRYAKLWKIHSLMVVPVRIEGRSVGVLRVGSFKPDCFTREHLELMTVIADETAVIVETAMLNRKLSQTAEQLKALNRIKDEFVSMVSHELKTPLTTIMGFTSILLRGETGPLSEQQAKFLNVTKNAASRLNTLVTELLDLSKLEGGAPLDKTRLRLDALARESVENHGHQAQEGGKTLLCRIPAEFPPAWGDERWISLVLDNLVSNAVKFTRPGGAIQLSLEDKGDFLRVCVADDGIGVAPEDKERIFERFFRARQPGESNIPGTGLGLAIAKEIIDRHGGKIWFESEPGKGTKFYFILPAASRVEAGLP